MSILRLIEITLDRDLIYPRTNITGIVKLKSVDDVHVKHFFIEIFGRAECRWEEDKSFLGMLGRNSKVKIHHHGEQDYFYCRHTLGGREERTDEETIFEKRTNHLFPFKCRLPGHLPPTWTGKLGSLRYFAKATLRHSDGTHDEHAIKNIFVTQYRDLKNERHLLNEARKDVKRTYRFSLLNLGTVEVSVWLPLCGIAAGQRLPILCTIKNNSSVRFNGIVFVLTQIEIYRSHTPRKATKLVRTDICRIPRLTDIVDGVVEYYAVLQTTKDTFPTSQFWRCNCCQLTYEAWISLQAPIPDRAKYGYPNMDTPGIPVIVGTEPLCTWDSNRITGRVMQALLDSHPPIMMEPPPPDEVVEEMLNTVEEDMDMETMKNLGRQIDINENLVDS